MEVDRKRLEEVEKQLEAERPEWYKMLRDAYFRKKTREESEK